MKKSSIKEIKERAVQIIRELESDLYIESGKNHRRSDYKKLIIQAKVLRKALERLEERL